MASAQWQMPFYWHEERKMKPFSYIYKPLIQKCQFIEAKRGTQDKRLKKKVYLLQHYCHLSHGLHEGIANIDAILAMLYLLWYIPIN